MNTLKDSYMTVIEHVAADLATLKHGGQIADTISLTVLQQRNDWLISRMIGLDGQRRKVISEMNNRLEAYLCQCERFWKCRHERAYEKKLKQLDEAQRRVINISTLTGFDACYALLLALKHLRAILPLPGYEEHKPALAALEGIKKDCQEQLATYIKV